MEALLVVGAPCGEWATRACGQLVYHERNCDGGLCRLCNPAV